MNVSGFLNIQKEKGMTSHDAVNRIRRIIGTKKVGHTGTLDPNAEGVLLIAVERGTKFIQYLENSDKKYRAELILGISTDTDDITGKQIGDIPFTGTLDDLISALDAFKGEIMQVPPAYSARKINGRKLYEYARKGKVVDIPARPVTIYDILCTDSSCFPRSITLDIACSKGTYIRSLCRDIGKHLGCSACMGDLVREAVGNCALKDALTFEQVEALVSEGRLEEQIIKVESAFKDLPVIEVKERALHFINNGGYVYQWNSLTDFSECSEGVIYQLIYQDRFLGLGEYTVTEDEIYVKPLKLV